MTLASTPPPPSYLPPTQPGKGGDGGGGKVGAGRRELMQGKWNAEADGAGNDNPCSFLPPSQSFPSRGEGKVHSNYDAMESE